MDVRRLAQVAAVKKVNVFILKLHSTVPFNRGSSGVLKVACKTEFSQQRLDLPFMPLFSLLGTCSNAPELYFLETLYNYKGNMVYMNSPFLNLHICVMDKV